ncbi:hypothetical protein [Priestia megaterium]|uniref:hypothetical protein n=1 Tax=Priestia megaterium TaxID=1404 RepID=UPI000BF5EDE9|nr:hypothetical protein [Priestia megaterium]PFQ82045.1 hypothetical protein COK11_16325 [Priestia megaterium]
MTKTEEKMLNQIFEKLDSIHNTITETRNEITKIKTHTFEDIEAMMNEHHEQVMNRLKDIQCSLEVK